MPTGNLPADAKKLWEQVYNSYKADGKDASIAAQAAWRAVENAGWVKGKDGQWVKKAELSEFSLTIKKASFDAATNEYRWRADASDIESDSYQDRMSVQLFKSFIRRIESKERPPEHFCSDFWSGGMPYLSISHYLDLNGEGVPGPVDSIYLDGAYLKAKGKFLDTPLGKACWNSLKTDLEKRSLGEPNDPVRISIAFLDYQHKHNSNGYLFTRSKLDDVCPECVKERISGDSAGKVFLDGHLIHLALTRVPVNKRTSMEVDKSMTTRKEDAESIVGKELAEELDEKALTTKSEALVVKSDTVDLAPLLDTVTALTSQIAEMRSEFAELKSSMMDAKKKKKMDEMMPEDESPDEETAEGGVEEPVASKKKKVVKKSDIVDETAVVVDEPVVVPSAPDYAPFVDALAAALATAMTPTTQKLDVLLTAVSQKSASANTIPIPRSLQPSAVPQIHRSDVASDVNTAKPMRIADFVKKSVGG